MDGLSNYENISQKCAQNNANAELDCSSNDEIDDNSSLEGCGSPRISPGNHQSSSVLRQQSFDQSSIGSFSRSTRIKCNIPRSKSTFSKAFGIFKRAKLRLKSSASVQSDLNSKARFRDDNKQQCNDTGSANRSNNDGKSYFSRASTAEKEPSNLTLGSVLSSEHLSCYKSILSILKNSKLPIVCAIKSLEGELIQEALIHRYETGQYLIDTLKKAFDIGCTKYFGLRIIPNSGAEQSGHLPWLKLRKSVFKQVVSQNKIKPSVRLLNASSSQLSVEFRLYIRYYPSNTTNLQDSFLKQYLWLQLKRDIRVGRLTSNLKNLSYVVACVIQYDYGDYKPELVDQVKEGVRRILPRQEPRLMSSAMDYWQNQLSGCKQHQTQMRLFRAAVFMETYGFEYYPVRDHQRRRPHLLGFNYIGVKTIRKGQIVHSFWWHNISKVSYERQMLILHIYSVGCVSQRAEIELNCLFLTWTSPINSVSLNRPN